MTEIIIASAGIILLILLIRNSNKLAQVLRTLKELVNRPTNSSTVGGSPTCRHSWKIEREQLLQGVNEHKLVVILTCELCGALDKTIEVVKVVPPRSECCHDWETQRSKETPSAWEQMSDAQRRPYEFAQGKIQPWMFHKTIVSTRICSKCGEINTVVASNYEMDECKV